MKVIVGTCFDYPNETVLPFLESLESNFNGVLHLFTNISIEFEPLSYVLKVEIINKSDFDEILPIQLNNANNYRYFLYQQLLNNHSEYTEFLLTDVRDVLFQDDPFTKLKHDLLLVCSEEKNIGEEPYNSAWIEAVYGKSYLLKVSEEKVYCSGTIMGRRPVMEIFLKDMCCALILNGRRLDTANNNMIIDQALYIDWVLNHYHLVFENKNESGFVYTMGHAKIFRLNKDGKFLNADNLPYAILHQYDRFAWIKAIHTKWTGQVNSNPRVLKLLFSKFRKFF